MEDYTQLRLEIKSFFDLLEKGEEEIKLIDEYRDVILVLGNTGAGKTTFTQWIAGDNAKLISKEITEGTGEYIIYDNNRISNSTIKSKTIFPELVIDKETNATYYDCPGFSDTRSTANDIATTYFIKKILDHAENVKLIFTVNHSSVRTGVDRKDFMKLMRHTTDLVKDINKFQNSIALIATKVDNHYIKQGKSFSVVADDKVIEAIGDFLQEVKQELTERVNLPDISTKEKKICRDYIDFINVLLAKDDDNYKRIGIFRRPDEPGSLSNITLLQEGKKHIEKILHKKLNYTEKNADDFGYTISETSKIEINDFVEEINENIWSNVKNTAEKIQEHYRDLFNELRNRIKSFVTTCTVKVDQSVAQTYSSKLSNGYNFISNTIDEIKILTNPEELARKINNTLISLDIQISDSNLVNIANLGKYFNFLQVVSEKKLRTRLW